MFKKVFIIVSVWLGVFLFAQGSQETANPCELLSKQEVEQTMKIKMKEGRLRDNRSVFGDLSCKYLSVEMFEHSGSVTIDLAMTSDMKAHDAIYASAKEKYEKEKYAHLEALKSKHKEGTFHPLPGLGDDAYWGTVSLTVLKGEYYIKIRVLAGAGIQASGKEELEKKISAKNLEISKKFAKILLKKIANL